MIPLLLLLGCVHRAHEAPAVLDEARLRAACRKGDPQACAALVGMLEAGAFGEGRAREAWELAAASDEPDLALRSVLLAEAHQDIVVLAEREAAWERLCDGGFLPGCEVGARTLRLVAPETAARLAATACARDWAPSCGPLEPVPVELPEVFAAALAEAGGAFYMPQGFHPVEPAPRAGWALVSDDDQLRVDYLVADDGAMVADGRFEVIVNMLSVMAMNVTGRLPDSEVHHARFPTPLVAVEYNAHAGATATYLSGAGQILVIWIHSDPDRGLWMVLTFDDPDAATDLLPIIGHSIGFVAPVGLAWE